MSLEHQVWAVPPGKSKSAFFAAYELSRWQWAMKLIASLEYRGFQDVQLKTVEEDEDQELDDD